MSNHKPESLTIKRASHNQGIWEIFGPEDSSPTGIPTKPVIARVTAAYYGPDASEYYARLFAAAPAMLAALEALIAAADRESAIFKAGEAAGKPDKEINDELAEAIADRVLAEEKAREAIKAARGEA